MSATIPPIAYCNFSRNNFVPSKSSVSKCCFLVLLTFCIVFMNLLMIAVLHSPNHHRFLKRQPRYFMTSLAITDLAFGTLVTPFSIFSSLYSCWPLGSIACVVEALLMGSLFHQSALSLMCIAIDRYICIVHPLRYHAVMTTKVCFTMIALSWITSFTIYSILVYPHFSRYTFDAVAFLTCEPYYGTKWITISLASLFYIPPVSVISFCYLTVFFVAQKQFQRMKSVAITSTSCDENPIRPSKMMSKECLKKYQTTFCLAFMAFGFAVVLTPLTLLAIISTCLNIQMPEHVLFAAAWTGFSNCFWNPVIYGAMNKSFRDVASEVLSNALCVKKWKKICRSENTSPLSQFDAFT